MIECLCGSEIKYKTSKETYLTGRKGDYWEIIEITNGRVQFGSHESQGDDFELGTMKSRVQKQWNNIF